MKTHIETIGYSESVKTQHNTGWGCGYVHIPKGHPILVMLDEDNRYIQPEGISQEITYSVWKGDYYVIGFDTAHSYNGPHHDKEYVIRETQKIKEAVDNFTMTDAKIFALKQIKLVENKYKKYL